MFRKRLVATGVVAALLLTLLGNAARANTTATPVDFPVECPKTITCEVVPAAQEANNGNLGDYGNYDITNRPVDMVIDRVTIHDIEGTAQAAIDLFKDPTAYVSAHYVVDNVTGKVTQMVPLKDMPWHSSNWWQDMHGVGIEVAGFSATGLTDYTPQTYYAVAELVKYLTARFNIPRDRAHIAGHDNVPATETRKIAGMHTDPGPYWNWERLMWMIGAPVLPTGGLNAPMITVAPIWSKNKQLVEGCWNTHCAPAGPQSTNFAYVRTAPDLKAPLIADPILGQGTYQLQNNAARAFYGQSFVVKQRKFVTNGVWYQVWFGGQLGWIYSPWLAPTAFPTTGKMVTPKPGLATIPIYGRPALEQSDYPSDFVVPAGMPIRWLAEPLAYTIAAGQHYKLLDATIPTDHFYAWNVDPQHPYDKYDHSVFIGGVKYYQIEYGARHAYVKASDVVIH